MSDWYDKTSAPATGSALSSATIRSEFAAIEAAMAKLPALAGNGGLPIAINSGGSAIEEKTVAEFLALLGSVTKYKTADTSRNSTTTIANDAHLIGWSLEADTVYKIDGALIITSGAGSMDIGLDVDQTPQDGSWGANAAQQNSIGTTPGERSFPAATEYVYPISGYIHTHATLTTTMNLQWAQNSSNADPAILHKGSWIRLEKLGTA